VITGTFSLFPSPFLSQDKPLFYCENNDEVAAGSLFFPLPPPPSFTHVLDSKASLSTSAEYHSRNMDHDRAADGFSFRFSLLCLSSHTGCRPPFLSPLRGADHPRSHYNDRLATLPPFCFCSFIFCTELVLSKIFSSFADQGNGSLHLQKAFLLPFSQVLCMESHHFHDFSSLLPPQNGLRHESADGLVSSSPLSLCCLCFQVFLLPLASVAKTNFG